MAEGPSAAEIVLTSFSLLQQTQRTHSIKHELIPKSVSIAKIHTLKSKHYPRLILRTAENLATYPPGIVILAL